MHHLERGNDFGHELLRTHPRYVDECAHGGHKVCTTDVIGLVILDELLEDDAGLVLQLASARDLEGERDVVEAEVGLLGARHGRAALRLPVRLQDDQHLHEFYGVCADAVVGCVQEVRYYVLDVR